MQPGQRVTGILPTASRHLALTLPALSPADLAVSFPDRAVTLALVRQVDKLSAELALHPTSTLLVQRDAISPNELDRPDLLLSPGEVVIVRVVHTQGGIRLRLDDIDDDEPVMASLPVVAGGEPWLLFDQGRPLQRRDIPEPPVARFNPKHTEIVGHVSAAAPGLPASYGPHPPV